MKILAAVIVVISVVALGAGAYMGAFQRVVIAELDQGPFTLVYRDMAVGEMSKVGEITTALNALLEAGGMQRRKPLDVFYPDGRGEIGFAVEGATPERLAGLSDRAKVREIPVQRCMTTEAHRSAVAEGRCQGLRVDPAGRVNVEPNPSDQRNR